MRNSQVVDLLTDEDIKIKPLFVTLDPKRDTLEILKEYTDFHHKDMIGLTGSNEQIDTIKKIQKKNGRVFCIVGDGEINEGSIWESILIAVNNKLSNLIVIIDYNKSQIRSLEPNLNVDMFKSFGCDSVEIDGQDEIELDLRLICATHQNIEKKIEQKQINLKNLFKGGVLLPGAPDPVT